MGVLGALAFLSPWWLAALAGLPILYWLLRVTPPAPRHERFPAIRLLLQLTPKEETPAKTPLWLLLLRLMLAALIIFALAHPLLNPSRGLESPGPLLAVVDDGWAAARNWPARRAALEDLIDRAERDQRPVAILATAPSLTGEPPRLTRLMRAQEARATAAAIEPKPWPIDRAAARAALDQPGMPTQAAVVYLSDGLDDAELGPLLDRLQRLGGVDFLADPPESLARLLLPPLSEASGLTLTAARVDAGPPAQSFLRALTDDGRVLGREELRWEAGQKSATARLVLPTELRNRLTRIEIEGEASAGTVVLLDERWRRRPVGLFAGGTTERQQQPLLSEIYYLERALTPFAEVRTGTVVELLKRELAVLVLADIGRLADADRSALDGWVRKGGVMVRFAGPRTAEAVDDLVPTPLRVGGGRTFGGAMSWAQPVALAAFDPAGAFAGLAVPEDVRVSRQVLAEPSLDLATRTWARLSDGTPLVTGDKRGDGWLVMVHTMANPEWSTLPLSGLFVEMLRRLVGLSQGIAAETSETLLPPLSSLDGYGRLQAPPPAAVAISSRALAKTVPSPKFPPGFYGSDLGRRAVNLSAALPTPRMIEQLPSGIVRGAYARAQEVDFKPWLLAAALVLTLIDLCISLWLRGLWPRPAARGTAIVLLCAMAALPAAAQTPGQRGAAGAGEDGAAMTGTLSTRLGYIKTGNPEIDELSRAGLNGLGAVLTRRTAVDPGQPVEIDVERQEMAFFPLVYWPVLPETPAPSTAAVAQINAYLRNGGTILFDTRDGNLAAPGTLSPGATRLRDLLRQLNLSTLAPVPPDHVLTKAFYLINEFPGRWAGGKVWVEQADDRVNDGVSPVIIGANDWASAWATDGQGRPMHAVVPGGEAQRETALRFGVNLVMYALTGNYKADQVHIEAILERLRR